MIGKNVEETAVAVPPSVGAAGDEAPGRSMEFMSAVAQFTFASVSMMLGNKLAVTYLPLPCTLVFIQALGTLLLLVTVVRGEVDRPTMRTAQRWLPIAVLFTFMLYTSLKSFVYAGVATVLIFRNIGAIFTTVVEYFVRGVTVNARIVASEVLIVIGAVMYGWGAIDFSWVGLFWILINVAGQVAYGVLLKKMMDVQPSFKEMSKFTMSMYNNLLAMPLVLVILVLQGEQHTFGGHADDVSGFGWAVILLTCFLGFLISTAGFGLQKLVSATTFIVINNMTKFLNLILGMAFLNDKLAGFYDACGCLIALGAGCWYSYELNQFNDQQKKEKEAKLKKEEQTTHSRSNSKVDAPRL
jgi:drug/metabolite transporter (DMT)-like permease